MSYTLPHAVYTAFDETTKLYTAYQMQAAYQAGRASRDAEVEDWKRGSDAEAKEVDRLTKEVEALRADAEREIWTQVEGYEGIYEVSSVGRIRSLNRIDSSGKKRRGKYLHPSPTTKGYLKVSLWSGGEFVERYVHRLVANAFHKNPDAKPEVNHIDGDPANNHVSNLEWVTTQQNTFHAGRVLRRLGNCPVSGVSLKDGSLIKFDSMTEAAEAGFPRANILSCLKGNRKHAGGYSWSLDAARAAQED